MNLKNTIMIFILSGALLIATESYAELKNGQAADVVVGQVDFTTGTSGSGTNKFNAVNLVFTDGKRLFALDNGNNRVLIYNTIPTQNGQAADVVVGQPDFTTTSTGTTTSKLNVPRCVFSDGKRLYIADRDNHRVLIYNNIPTQNGQAADVVIGVTGSSGTTQSKLKGPYSLFSDGKKLFIGDNGNYRVLIYNTIPTTNGAFADVVVGQPDFITAISDTTASKLSGVGGVYSDGKKLFIGDTSNNRVLIYNTIPTSNGASADVVVGQPNFTTNGIGCTASTFNNPYGVYSDGKKLFVADFNNARVLIYNAIPTTNGASADVVVGQPNFTTNGIGTTATTNRGIIGFSTDGKRLFIADRYNNRVLIYNIASSSPEKLGPQFEQGKAVVGKVFNDVNGNGIQDNEEDGIEGVKVVSDTGIYAITDSDGKYHFPYIEVGQHLLKIDTLTLPEGSEITTDNPYKVTVTEGILTKVSFGVKLPEEDAGSPAWTGTRGGAGRVQGTEKKDEPLLKVSVSQDPLMLKSKLAIKAKQDKETITFDIQCNYYLFIEESILTIYDKDYNKIKDLTLPKPIPPAYSLPIQDLPTDQKTFYYQLSVYDKNGKRDRTGVGSFEI